MPLPGGCRSRDRSPRVWASCVASVAAALLLAGLPASAQTLTEAFAYAYNNSPQLLAQRAALRATDEGVPQALSNWRPTVNFTGSAGYSRGGSEVQGVNTKTNAQLGLQQPCVDASGNSGIGLTCTTPTQFANFVSKQLDLKITQPVYRGGRTEAQTRQAINTVAATRAQTLGVETTVLQALAQSYLGVVYRTCGARQRGLRPRRVVADGLDHRRSQPQLRPVVHAAQLAPRHSLGDRPTDNAALRRRRDLFADPSGAADRRTAAQPGR